MCPAKFTSDLFVQWASSILSSLLRILGSVSSLCRICSSTWCMNTGAPMTSRTVSPAFVKCSVSSCHVRLCCGNS